MLSLAGGGRLCGIRNKVLVAGDTRWLDDGDFGYEVALVDERDPKQPPECFRMDVSLPLDQGDTFGRRCMRPLKGLRDSATGT